MYRVELKDQLRLPEAFTMLVFLMYRVELKVPCKELNTPLYTDVPNVPCGVESYFPFFQWQLLSLFLMYRVELKAGLAGWLVSGVGREGS